MGSTAGLQLPKPKATDQFRTNYEMRPVSDGKGEHYVVWCDPQQMVNQLGKEMHWFGSAGYESKTPLKPTL
jgi:hypothetical protein